MRATRTKAEENEGSMKKEVRDDDDEVLKRTRIKGGRVFNLSNNGSGSNKPKNLLLITFFERQEIE